MGRFILIYGKSGSGKSRSLKNFAEDEIFLIQTIKKDLPFKKKFKYTMITDKMETIKTGLRKMPTKIAVIDDAGYIMTNEFMREHSSVKAKGGSASFDLFNDIADHFWSILNETSKLPDDVNVYILMHEETSDYGDTKLRTIGKLLDQKVVIEGMTTVAIRCVTEAGRHIFKTVTDGADITKAPEEMFDSDEIDNDLKLVDTKIREYYGMKSSYPLETKEETKDSDTKATETADDSKKENEE